MSHLRGDPSLYVGTETNTHDDDRSNFEDFVRDVEPRLSRALVARFGRDRGREATVDALVYGWTHWSKVQTMSNPAGYLYRVGVSSVKPDTNKPVLSESITWSDPWVEPSLDRGLAQLSDLQRTALVLHHSFTWTYEEIADLLGVSVSTVRSHIERGMRKLRQTLKVVLDG